MVNRPKRCNESQLALVGIELVSAHNLDFRCMKCGCQFSPMLQEGGRLPRGYWKCPNGCNEPAPDQ